MSKRIIADLTLQADEKVIEDADQVEWEAFKAGSAVIDYALLDDNILGDTEPDGGEAELELDDEWFDGEEEGDVAYYQEAASSPYWLGRAETEEMLASKTAEEIKRRSLILGSLYPFDVSGNQLVYKRKTLGPYEFCLAISISNQFSKKPFNRLPPAFEKFATRILKGWLGPESQAWQTGWPGRMAAGLPRSLEKLYEIVFEQTGEWEWHVSRHIAPRKRDQQKDLGVDLLIWKPLGDGRASSLFLAGQCACGRDLFDGAGKAADLNSKWLDKWFREKSMVDFVRCLIFPRCLSGSSSAVRISSDALFFDRLRLVLAAKHCEPELATLNEQELFTPVVEIVRKAY